ncbi:hypothetical protein QN277_003587 [Acacia crassicarpa]|uniref:Endonuclease/exonuclease/phosphatase domain-containing protein n=1 Tax=Acacia crassicarpa TaxID=499986 RepID=A0AAE1MFP1_9FABA|nr:hypothetical protein QN277_003587 [Acacia crassicarpa]
MIIASWNCRGADRRSFPLTIKDIVNKYCINILCLLEPCISGDRADKVCRRLCFSHWIRVEASGFSGGIWVLWDNDTFDITYLSSSTQTLHCQVYDRTNNSTSLVTMVYGETTLSSRNPLWDSLRSLAINSTLPWLVLGDFNAFMSPTDKLGGAAPLWASMQQFRDCIDDTSLLEPMVHGDKFTWEKEGLKERLDWVFNNLNWLNYHPNFTVRHELKFKSDNRIVVVNSSLSSQRRSFQKTFSYQIAWTLENDFKDLTTEAWQGKNWLDGLQNFHRSALEWNDNRVGNFTSRKKKIIRRLEGIDRSRSMNLQSSPFRLEKKLWDEYHKVATQEEIT